MDQTAGYKWAKLAVIGACAMVPLFGVGCEDAQSKADRQVRQTIRAAELAAYEENGAEKAAQLLQEATQVQEAGDAAKADAYLRAAQTDYARAISKLPGLTESEAKVNQFMEDIAQLGLRLAANNQLIEAYKGNDPAGAAQGDPLKVLETSKANCVALVKALNQKTADTNKQIQAKTAEIAALESNRAKAAAQADTLLVQSEQAKGQVSVDTYKQALDARSAAASLAYNIGNSKVALARLQQTLLELQQQTKIAQEGIATIDKQLAESKKSSADVRKAIQSRIAVGKSIATHGTDPVPGKVREPGIEAKTKELATAITEADAKRKDIDADLTKAIQAYEEAAAAANKAWASYDAQLRDMPAGSPGRPAIEKLRRMYSPLSYNMDKARVLQARGHVYASCVGILEAKQRLILALTPAFKQANFQLPTDSLKPQDLPKETQETRKVAEQCFDDASKIFEDAMERGEPNEKAAAQFPRIGAQYALYTLTGKADRLASARALLKEAAGASAPSGDEPAQNAPAKMMPAFPMELEQGIIDRTKAASAPTTKPATAPADNAAPAENPQQ